MPGTIHVSVLDFSDLPSTSSVLFKVFMGKREYQTLDRGDFAFPVKSLREKLILVVLDDVGSETRQTVIEAILIVQKGQWDDYFSFDGGGRVRMRLQFVLSDDDRVKIRKMRESALQKKRSQLLITHPELRKTISLDAGFRNNEKSGLPVNLISVLVRQYEHECAAKRNDGNAAGKTIPVNDYVSFISTQLFAHEESEGVAVINEQNDTKRAKEATAPSTVTDAATNHSAEVNTMALVQNRDSGALNFKPITYSSKGKLFIPKVDDQEGATVKEGMLRKTPSSVRNMISAFECNTTQDTKSRNKPPPLKAPIIKLALDNPSHDLVADEVVVAAATKKLAEMSSEIVVSSSFFSELQQKVSAKKRQISYDVVEIVTIAPERDLTEVDTVVTDELVTEPLENETCASAFDTVDRLDIMAENVRICDMASGEDDTTVPAVETEDNVELKDMEVENKDKPFFDDNTNFLTVEKDSIDQPEGDSDSDTCYDPPLELMRNLDDETENYTTDDYTVTVTKDDNGSLENDKAATVDGDSLDDTHSAKLLLFDDAHSDILNSGGRMMEVISENKLPSEDADHANKETTQFTKLENTTKSLIEWSTTGEPPRSWVFPDESRASCIIQLTNFIGGSEIYAVKDSKHSAKKPVDESPRSCDANDSADDGYPKGQFAQVIKITIMVAFGALVFFSRQRNRT